MVIHFSKEKHSFKNVIIFTWQLTCGSRQDLELQDRSEGLHGSKREREMETMTTTRRLESVEVPKATQRKKKEVLEEIIAVHFPEESTKKQGWTPEPHANPQTWIT